MSRYALIDADNVVKNIVVWDGVGDIFKQYTTINVDDISAEIGWSWDGSSFVAASSPVLTPEEIIAQAESEKRSRIQVASDIISPFQDAVDLGEATEAEISSLAAWKKYRVLLNRVDTSKAQDIEWPDSP